MIIHPKLIIHLPFPISHCFSSLKHHSFRWLTQAFTGVPQVNQKCQAAASECTFIQPLFAMDVFYHLVKLLKLKAARNIIAKKTVTQASWLSLNQQWLRIPNDTGNYAGTSKQVRDGTGCGFCMILNLHAAKTTRNVHEGNMSISKGASLTFADAISSMWDSSMLSMISVSHIIK